MDTAYFEEAKQLVLDRQKLGDNGIGTLAEKTVHSVLKQYLSRDFACQEIKVGSFVADVMVEGHIFEIQTRNFDKLRRKLTAFLPEHPVTVVYPVSHRNCLRWVMPDTGEISTGRFSSRTGNPLRVFAELYRIRPYLTHPNFSLKIVLMDTEEFRLLNGYGRARKNRATKCDKFPVSLIAEYDLETPADYMMLLPPELPDRFISKDFARITKIPLSLAQTTLLILTELGIVNREKADGRFYQYELVSNASQSIEN